MKEIDWCPEGKDFTVSYGDQEHSKIYIRREGTDEYIYLDYNQTKKLYDELKKYVGKQ